MWAFGGRGEPIVLQRKAVALVGSDLEAFTGMMKTIVTRTEYGVLCLMVTMTGTQKSNTVVEEMEVHTNL